MGVGRAALPHLLYLPVCLLAACAGATTTHREDAAYMGARPATVLVSAEIRASRADQTAAANPGAHPDAHPGNHDRDARLLVDAAVKLLKARNVPAEAAAANATSNGHAFVVRMTVSDIENGNYWERMAVGMGWGQSSLNLHVDMTDSADNKRLLSFDVAADSGNEPGLITSFVNVTGGVIIPVMEGGVSVYHIDGLGTAKDIDNAANAAVFGLTSFFRRLGWDDWTGSSGTALGMSAAPIPSPKPYR